MRLRLRKIYLFEPLFWLYFSWYFLPFFRGTFSSSMYKTAFFACFVVGISLLEIRYIMKRKAITLHWNVLSLALIYMCMLTFMYTIDYKDAAVHIRISFTFWGSLLAYYALDKFPEAKRRLGYLLIVLFILTSITTLIGVLSNPAAARTLTYASNDVEQDALLMKLNIGSVSFIQSQVITIPIFVLFMKKKKHILISMICIVFIFISVASASFAISMIGFFFALTLGIIYNKSSLKVAVTILLGGMLLWLIPWGTVILEFAQIINNDVISARLNELAIGIEGTGNLPTRFNLYMVSFKTFLSNPLGIGPEYKYVRYVNGIGYHSQIIDDFARYGIFAIAFYVIFAKEYSALLRQRWAKVNMPEIAIPVTIVYIFFLFLNLGMKSSAESIMVLFIIPVIPELILYKSVDVNRLE